MIDTTTLIGQTLRPWAFTPRIGHRPNKIHPQWSGEGANTKQWHYWCQSIEKAIIHEKKRPLRRQKVFHWYIDPSHSWLKVPLDMLLKLGIHKEISHCSYISLHKHKKPSAYLEEDCDAFKFMSAYHSFNLLFRPEVRMHVREHTTNKLSIIRHYPPFRCDTLGRLTRYHEYLPR